MTKPYLSPLLLFSLPNVLIRDGGAPRVSTTRGTVWDCVGLMESRVPQEVNNCLRTGP